ncbi:MAG: FHA domain-containing protein [Dehalococcoidia bacterium]
MVTTPDFSGRFGTLTWYTPDGTERMWPIENASLMVGRADTSDLLLDDLSVSRRHARLTIENGRLLVEDLGSSAGTFIDGHPIPPRTPSLVDPGQELRFGSVLARFSEPPPIEASDTPSDAIDERSNPVPVAVAATARVTLIAPATPAVPGGPAVVARLLVHNSGRVVDQLSVAVLDLPAEWVRIATPQLVLVPGESSEVPIAISVPKRPDAAAGTYEFNVVVTSIETQREVFSSASVVVPAFQDTLFELRPKRSKKNFTLATENRGNDFLVLDLRGNDDEEALDYSFQPPVLSLDPGQSERVRVRVRGPRRLFGRPETVPFAIIGQSAQDPSVSAQSSGQLLIRPPLQRMLLPTFVLLALAAGILAALAYYFWPVWPFNDNDGTVSAADDQLAKVFPMCEPDAKEDETVVERPADEPTGLYFQNDPRWAEYGYARAQDPDFGPDWCGDTISDCGCAMTSVANIMTLLGMITMPAGQTLTPQTLNDWLNLDAQRTSRGWVSRGYSLGDVVWSGANQLSGEMHAANPAVQTIRYVGFGTGTDEEIKNELRNGRPVILAVPGHFIAATGLDGETIQILDPFFPERTTLDWYTSRGVKVLGSRKFEPSSDLSGVMLTAPHDVRIKVTNKNTGQIVGILSKDSPEEAAGNARVEVDGASYAFTPAWRDPTCTERAPDPGVGVNQMWLPGSIDDYIVEYLNTTSEASIVAVHSYDKSGKVRMLTLESPPTNIIESFDAVAPPPTATPTATSVTPPPGVGTPTPKPGGSGSPTSTASATTPAGGGSPTPPAGGGSPTPGGGGTTPTASATATATPTLPAPTAVKVTCGTVYKTSPKVADVTCTGEVSGAFTSLAWSVNGVATPASGLVFTSSFTSDTALTVQLKVCNQGSCNEAAASVVVKFPDPPTASPNPVTPAPPASGGSGGGADAQAVDGLNLGCAINYVAANGNTDLVCTAEFTGPFTVVTWAAPGTSNPNQSSALKSYFTSVPFPAAALAASASVPSARSFALMAAPQVAASVAVTVCNYGACDSKTVDLNLTPELHAPSRVHFFSPAPAEGGWDIIVRSEGDYWDTVSCLDPYGSYIVGVYPQAAREDAPGFIFGELDDGLFNFSANNGIVSPSLNIELETIYVYDGGEDGPSPIDGWFTNLDLYDSLDGMVQVGASFLGTDHWLPSSSATTIPLCSTGYFDATAASQSSGGTASLNPIAVFGLAAFAFVSGTRFALVARRRGSWPLASFRKHVRPSPGQQK